MTRPPNQQDTSSVVPTNDVSPGVSTPSDDWSDLTQTWAAASDDEPRLDTSLIRALRRRDRLAQLNFASEILGGFGVLGAVGWALWRGGSWPIACAAIAFVALALGLTLWSRRGDPGLLTDTPQAVLQSAIGQARTGYRWGMAGVGISIAGMAFLTFMLAITEPLTEQRAPLFIGALAFLTLCIGFYLRHARLCRRRMEAHQAALEALNDG